MKNHLIFMCMYLEKLYLLHGILAMSSDPGNSRIESPPRLVAPRLLLDKSRPWPERQFYLVKVIARDCLYLIDTTGLSLSTKILYTVG